MRLLADHHPASCRVVIGEKSHKFLGNPGTGKLDAAIDTLVEAVDGKPSPRVYRQGESE